MRAEAAAPRGRPAETPITLKTPLAAAAAPSERKTGPIRELFSHIVKGAAVAAVAVALLFGNVHPAEAARSAGRVGGFAGSSASSAPSRSYGGGGSSYSGGGGGYSRGGGGYSPSYGGSYLAAPSPYYGGGVSTYLMPPPVVVAPYAAGPAVAVGTGASSALDAALLMGLAFIAFSTVSSALAPGRTGGLVLDSDDEFGEGGAGGGPLQVTKVQVGLLAVARELKARLDAIAEGADTSTSEGLHALLQEVVLALLRNPQYCAYSAGGKKAAASARDLERSFNAASLAERSKFSEETLVNVRGGGGVRRSKLRAAEREDAERRPDELIVVTLLVATRGGLKLPQRIDSVDALRGALRALGGLRAEQVLGVEVIWTPQAAGDSFSRDELISDYPEMRSL